MSEVEVILMIPAFLFSICLHEYAHAYVAWLAGDDTAALSGRLTLNPIAHIDPIGTVLLPAMLLFSGAPVVFGWARPVPVNPMRFRKSSSEVWVSLAGPLANLVLIVGSVILIKFLFLLGLGQEPRLHYVFVLLTLFVLINLVLMLFNLIPIPPLDGSHVLYHFLRRSEEGYRVYVFLQRYGMILLLLLVFIPATRHLFGSVVYWLFSLLSLLISL